MRGYIDIYYIKVCERTEGRKKFGYSHTSGKADQPDPPANELPP